MDHPNSLIQHNGSFMQRGQGPIVSQVQLLLRRLVIYVKGLVFEAS